MSAVAEVLVNLQAQVRTYRRLLDLSQAQVVALRDRDVQAVHAILQEIELTMIDRGVVDQGRTAILGRVATELGLPIEAVNVRVIQEHAGDASLAEGIGACSAELKELIGDLDVVVGKNKALLEQELAMIDHMVRGMTRGPRLPTYGNTGAQDEPARLKLLDMQV